MSLFRAPQVPQQPARYFTPGQPLGIPAPRMDAQMAQFAAYYRPRVEIQQPKISKTAAAIATQVSPQQLQAPEYRRWALEWIVENYAVEYVPLATPFVYVPAPDFFGFETTPDQPPQQQQSFAVQSAPATRVQPTQLQSLPSSRWALEWIVENYSVELTPGQPLGTPQPRQTDQTQSAWRQRVEIQQPVCFAPIPVPSSYAPKFEFQMAAYFPPHPITVEYLSEQLVTEFTQGNALGIPQPKQTDQSAAYSRQRVEALQPSIAPVYGPQVFAFVPAAALQLPQSISWRFEWLIDFLQPEFVPQQISASVPPIALQMPFAQSQRTEWSILLQQRVTAGIPLGIPQPRQSDQVSAYYRQHVEIQQPIYFALIPPIPISLRRDEFIAARDRILYTVQFEQMKFGAK